MSPSPNQGDLVSRFQSLCTAIQFFEPMDWHHPAVQDWLKANGFGEIKKPWDLDPAALWIVNLSLEKKLAKLEVSCKDSKKFSGMKNNVRNGRANQV